MWPAGIGMVRRTDLERRPGSLPGRPGHVRVAVEAVLAGVVAGLDLDQTDVEPGVAVRVEAERAGHVDRPDRLVGRDVVGDRMPRRGPGPVALRRGRRPPSQVSGSDQGPLRAERISGPAVWGLPGFSLVAPRTRGNRQHAEQTDQDLRGIAASSELSLDFILDRGRRTPPPSRTFAP